MVKKVEYSTSIFLMLVGMMFISSSVINFISNLKTKNWIELNASVVDYRLLEKGYISIKSGYKVSDKYTAVQDNFITTTPFVND